MECLDCGEPLTGWGTAPDAGVSALLRKRCPACALRRHSEARYPPKAKPCAFCSKPHQRGSDRKFCSPVCRLAYGGAWRDHRKWCKAVALEIARWRICNICQSWATIQCRNPECVKQRANEKYQAGAGAMPGLLRCEECGNQYEATNRNLDRKYCSRKCRRTAR